MNLYRGCFMDVFIAIQEANCYRILYDFEDIEVKENAVELLEKLLNATKMYG